MDITTVGPAILTENAIFLEQRDRLKSMLAEGEAKTFLGRMFAGTSRLVQKICRTPAPAPQWYSALILGLIQLLIFGLLPLLFGEAGLYQASHAGIPPIRLVAGTVLVIGSFVPISFGLDWRYRGLFTTLAEDFLANIETPEDLDDLQRWLAAAQDSRKCVLVAILYVVMIAPYNVVSLSSFLGTFIGIGGIYLQVITCFFSGISLYYFFLLLSFHLRIRRYRLKLYASDPSSSRAINILSEIFKQNEYILSAFLALITLSFAFIGVLPVYGIVVVLAGWIPLSILYAIHYFSLAQIISRAKWQNLYEIQSKIERIQNQEDPPGKENLEYINKLMDYYERLKDTNSSSLNLRGGLHFLNSLLLPLLAFLFGNFDKIQSLIQSLHLPF